MGPVRLPCSRGFTGNVSAVTWTSSIPVCCIARALCFDEKQFDGDENAIVDFKYSSSPKITWWFDHHESAFLSPADATHFEQDKSDRKFDDPNFKSAPALLP